MLLCIEGTTTLLEQRSLFLCSVEECLGQSGAPFFFGLFLSLRLNKVAEYGGILLHQGANMVRHTLSQRRDRPRLGRVTSLKYADYTPLAELVGDLRELLGRPLILEFGYFCVPGAVDVVLLMSVEASRNENHVWTELNELRDYLLGEDLAPLA